MVKDTHENDKVESLAPAAKRINCFSLENGLRLKVEMSQSPVCLAQILLIGIDSKNRRSSFCQLGNDGRRASPATVQAESV